MNDKKYCTITLQIKVIWSIALGLLNNTMKEYLKALINMFNLVVYLWMIGRIDF
jgi:hypothetical protein